MRLVGRVHTAFIVIEVALTEASCEGLVVRHSPDALDLLKLVTALANIIAAVKGVININLRRGEELELRDCVEVRHFARVVPWEGAANRIRSGVQVGVVLHELEESLAQVDEL